MASHKDLLFKSSFRCTRDVYFGRKDKVDPRQEMLRWQVGSGPRNSYTVS